MNDPTREDRIKPNPKWPGEWMVEMPGTPGSNRGFADYQSAVGYLQGLDDAVAARPVVPTRLGPPDTDKAMTYEELGSAWLAAGRVEQQQPTDAQVEVVRSALTKSRLRGKQSDYLDAARAVVAALGTTHPTEGDLGRVLSESFAEALRSRGGRLDVVDVNRVLYGVFGDADQEDTDA